jgi:hypothetical protein
VFSRRSTANAMTVAPRIAVSATAGGTAACVFFLRPPGLRRGVCLLEGRLHAGLFSEVTVYKGSFKE